MKAISIVDEETIIIKNSYYITKDEFKKLYLEQNLTKKELCEKYQLSLTMLSNIIKFFGLQKDYSLVRKNITNSIKDKYGVENISQIEEVKQKKRNSCLQRYGVDNISQVQEVKDKKRKSFLEKYGEEYLFQTEEFKEKMRNYYLQNYGVSNPSQKNIPQSTINILSCKENFEKYLNLFNKKKSYDELSEELKISAQSISIKAREYGLTNKIKLCSSVSKPENELANFINSLGVSFYRHNRKILSNKQEIDIYIPSQKIGIEFNGTYWHSEQFTDKNYHYRKSLEAEKNGIRLIHIYEYEWGDPVKKEIIKSLLRIAFGKAENKIYARNCEIREITNKEARPFNDANHLQGHRNAQVTYGLFYNDELVQLMSFSKTKYNKNLKGDNDWEIIRGCPGSNNLVVGGVSKLFKHFIKKYNPDSIFSYCDFNKFDGKGYEAIGMKCIGYTGPDMNWVLPGYLVEPRNPKRHKELKENSIGKIYGSGSKKYIWKKEK